MRGSSACAAPPSSHVIWVQNLGWQGGKSPYHPTNIDACSALGVVMLFFSPLLCPTRISEKFFSYFLPLPYKAESKKVVSICSWCSTASLLSLQWKAILPTEQHRRPQPFALLDLQCRWIYDLLLASEPLYEIVSFSFFTLMGDFTTNLFVLIMQYMFSC